MLEDISDRKLVEADLVHRTLHDPLTELPNRQYFLDRLRQTRARRFSSGAGVAVVFMDLDGFKEVNDSQGHQAGDELLLAVARRLREAPSGPSDTVARFGGDEFVVLAGEVESPTDATQLAWRLTNALRAPFAIGGATVAVTASMGVAYSADPRGRRRGHHPQGRRGHVPGQAAGQQPRGGVRGGRERGSSRLSRMLRTWRG